MAVPADGRTDGRTRGSERASRGPSGSRRGGSRRCSGPAAVFPSPMELLPVPRKAGRASRALSGPGSSSARLPPSPGPARSWGSALGGDAGAALTARIPRAPRRALLAASPVRPAARCQVPARRPPRCPARRGCARPACGCAPCSAPPRAPRSPAPRPLPARPPAAAARTASCWRLTARSWDSPRCPRTWPR